MKAEIIERVSRGTVTTFYVKLDNGKEVFVKYDNEDVIEYSAGMTSDELKAARTRIERKWGKP